MKQPLSPKKNPKNKALRLLAVRNYTRKELQQRLLNDQFNESEVEKVLVWLEEIGYLNDQRTAELYVEDRNRFRPTGKYGIKHELKKKGVAGSVIESVINSEKKDYELALNLAEVKLKGLQHIPPKKQYQRIGSLLGRRGFSWDVTRTVLNTLFSSFLDTDL